ncbi:hypothetical protein Dimus_030333 [Dionaea muscipula]
MRSRQPFLMCSARTGICEYIKEVWEESKYTKPLEITRRFANDATIMKAVRVQISRDETFSKVYSFSGNEKCDTSIWEERHLKLHGFDIYGSLNGKEDHESPYGDWLTLVFEAFGVPLVIKKGEEPKKYDFFEDTFLTMCKLTREDGIWWIGSGENEEGMMMRQLQRKRQKADFDWEAVIDEATVEGESGSGEKFYDAEEEAQGSPELPDEIPAEATPQLQLSRKIKNLQSRPSGPTAEMLEFRSSRQNLNEKEPTDFMMNWRRPKLRMPNF